MLQHASPEPPEGTATTDGHLIYLVAAQDGAAARHRGEPRDPAPYLPRYAGQRSLVSPAQAWLAAYDRMDALLLVEMARTRRRPDGDEPAAAAARAA
jgi:hypothetical protein